MLSRAAVLVTLGAVTIMTLMLLAGHGPWSGHVIWALDERHGLNSGDLIPMGLWLTATTACLVLWRKS